MTYSSTKIMHISITMHLEVGKRKQRSVNAAKDDGLMSRLLFVSDKNTRISYLVDTGANICIYSRSKIHGPANKSE